jgi:hypothetical protein
MLQATKEQSCLDAMLFGGAVLPLAAGGVPENSPQGYSGKNRASHQGRTFTNSTSALGIELTVRWGGVGSVDSARYYDPLAGRFLSEDPIGFLGGNLNLYPYAINDPLLFRDPSGRLLVGVLVGGVVGGD